ncbi:MAG: AAA family ATPase [Planctomycetaceae bacterium]
MQNQLCEQFRPASWTDVIGQDKALRIIDAIRRRGLGGRAFWISGKSGIGKTTIARLLAADVADDWFTLELDASDLTPARLRDIESDMGYRASGRGGRAYIVNEAHGLRKDTIRQLLVLLERLPSHVVVIFTTTTDGQAALFEDCDDSAPLLSRCVAIPLTSQGLAKPFAELAKRVAESIGMDGREIAHYVRLVQSCNNNMRAVYQAVESGAMMTV